jgi:hypothetical protein
MRGNKETTMQIELKTENGSIPCKLPYTGADHVILQGDCPNCKVPNTPIQGGDVERGFNTYTAPAACATCRVLVGKLVVTVSTIFGIEEDEAVLNGRARVY